MDYRLFKVAGSALILLFTGWLAITLGLGALSWLTMVICLVWLGVIALLAREYNSFVLKPAAAAV